MAEQVCPRCGLPKAQWQGNEGEGYGDQDGITFCCQGCAEGTGCTCVARGGIDSPIQQDRRAHRP